MRNFLKYNIPPALCGLIIILLTALPGEVLPAIPAFLDLFKPDKLVHVFMFGAYVFLQIRGFRKQTEYAWITEHDQALSLFLAILLSAGTEILQATCIPMRNGSVYDFIANLAGCAAGLLLARKFLISDRRS